ncbi:unnamed protein product, partial [Scytosiphon promiscuus]
IASDDVGAHFSKVDEAEGGGGQSREAPFDAYASGADALTVPHEEGAAEVSIAGGDVDDDDAEAEDSAVMKEIARLDEESIILDAETALMAIAVDGHDLDEHEDSEEGEQGRGFAAFEEGSERVGADGAELCAAAAAEGERGSPPRQSSDSGYAPDTEAVSAVAAARGDAPASALEAAKTSPEVGAAELDGTSTAAVGEGEEGEAAFFSLAAGGADGEPGASALPPVGDVDDEDNNNGSYASSADGASSESGEWHETIAAAAVDMAVRATLADLTAGVAIVVGGEEEDAFLTCSEVLSELQSDVEERFEGGCWLEGRIVGDGGGLGQAENAGSDVHDNGEQEEKGEGGHGEAHRGFFSAGDGAEEETENVPMPVGGREGALLRKGSSHRSLTIAVGAELEEEEPPVPRLDWRMNHIPMDSPLTPSRYDDEPAASASSLSPYGLAFAGMSATEGTGSPQMAEELSRAQDLLLTIDVDGQHGGHGDSDDVMAGTRILSPWQGAPGTLTNPLSPLSVGSSPEPEEMSELSMAAATAAAAEGWTVGRLSVLSEGGESSLSRESGSTTGTRTSDVSDKRCGGDADASSTAGGKKPRCMTGGTESTASPPSRRVSTESLPPPPASAALRSPASAT